MIIREAKDTDRPAIAAIHAASWADSYADILDPQYIQTHLLKDQQDHWNKQPIKTNDVVLIAESDAGAHGFIAIWVGETAYIDNLHVAPTGRSQGLGRKLMQAAAQRLQAQGVTHAELWVVTGNIRAIQFYKRLGARLTDRTKTIDLFGTSTVVQQMCWTSLKSLID